jgi:hypothetical protein
MIESFHIIVICKLYNILENVETQMNILCVCVLLGLELRAYALNHSTSPFCDAFFQDRVM